MLKKKILSLAITVSLVWCLALLIRNAAQSYVSKHPKNIEMCLQKRTPKKRYACYRSLCSPDADCLSTILKITTAHGGPEAGTNALKDIQASVPGTDESVAHELEHIVGRTTEETMGANAEAFVRCPSDFAYGCQHGFLEEALAKHTMAIKDTRLMCDSLNGSDKQKFLCNHGIGHGLMMYEGHVLSAALKDCASFEQTLAIQGCAQGVYMENFVAYMAKEPGVYGYDDNDLLAPCNRTNDKNNQWACYINHAPYLLVHFDFDVQKAANTCLYAPPDMIDTCIFKFGQVAAAPQYQYRILKKRAQPDSTKKSLAEKAAEICTLIPASLHTACNDGAIEHLLNYGQTKEAKEFCTLVEDSLKDECLKAIRTHET